MATSNLISCHFSTLSPPKLSDPKPRNSLSSLRPHSLLAPTMPRASISGLSNFLGRASAFPLRQKGRSEIFRRAVKSESNDGEGVSEIESEKRDVNVSVGDGSSWSDWTTSGFLLLIWAGLMYYFWVLSPNQTPSRDVYFAKKLLFLVRNDGFRMNQVLVGLWNIMGVWPLVYAQLLMPSGRSSRSNVKVWPFVLLSCAGGVYALFPYFVFWRPPPPPVEEAELKRWPLNFLESKITAAVSLAAGVGLLTYAGLASGADWKEFYQYFRESRFVNVTTLDFILISALAPFWVYNDMTARKSSDKGSWLLPLSVIPFFGPALYILLRPPVTTIPTPLSSSTASDPK